MLNTTFEGRRLAQNKTVRGELEVHFLVFSFRIPDSNERFEFLRFSNHALLNFYTLRFLIGSVRIDEFFLCGGENTEIGKIR